MEEIKKQVEEKIKLISEQGIKSENLELLGELVDIHKDLENEEYWKEKKEVMKMNRNYGNYDNYGREEYGRRRRDSRGRYRENMGRRHPSEEMLDEMYMGYQEYSEGREQYGRGNYGAKSGTMKSLEYMLQSVVDFIEMLKREAGSEEEIELIQKYTREISEM